jgi:hypothetical protein
MSVNALIPLHLVRNLGASEGFMALYALVELAAGAGVGTITAQTAQRIGTRGMIALAMTGTALSVLIAGIAQSLPITLLAAALSGASWTAVALIGLFAYFTESTPSAHMAGYSAAFHQVVGFATFVGPLMGGALAASNLDLATILVFGAALRLIAAPLIEPRLFGLIRQASVALVRSKGAA